MPRRSLFAVVLLAIGHRLLLICRDWNRAGEAAYGAFVADKAIALDFDAEEQRVVVAVGNGFENAEPVAAGFAFHPELLAGAAPEGDEAGLEGGPVAFRVEEADHEHFS